MLPSLTLTCSRLVRPHQLSGRLFLTVRRASTTAQQVALPSGFELHPEFLNVDEQRTLLKACLEKLDATDMRATRKLRRQYLASQPPTNEHAQIGSLFVPDEHYEFQQGHMDGVIRRYREMHVSSWPSSEELKQVIERVSTLLPEGALQSGIQTHILHLASDGYIDPHIDNIESSGSWILGVSLGDARDLVLETQGQGDPCERHRITLPSGSVYLQK